MKIHITIFLLFALALVGANAQEQINAMKVPGYVGQIGPQSRAWISSEYTDVILYPHTSIITDESMVSENLKAKKARVKALYNGKNIAFLIEWEDATKNIKEGCCSGTNSDGFALQFPTDYNDVTKLPYIRMGSKDRRVVVHLREAIKKVSKPNSDIYFRTLQEYYDTFHAQVQDQGDVDNGRVFIMEGLNFITEAKDNTIFSAMDIVYQDGTWKGTLSIPLKTEYLDLKNGAFPMSFVTWDGNSKSSDGVEYFSSWIGVKLVGERDGDELLDTLKIQASGDIYNGKKLAIENCATCHNFSDSVMAPQNMAPNLSNIGGYSSVQYLMESIIDPNAVVVPNYKPNVKPDFPWHNIDENGNLTSTMPSYDWLDEQSRNDLVVFFSSLKVQSEK